mmetsp:Transcript_8061/g.24100  ORF Transcript_8061/g.24100 Transcript_8061/m.24100 type:complete len:227 (-) Transcript_8061:166-846(-)
MSRIGLRRAGRGPRGRPRHELVGEALQLVEAVVLVEQRHAPPVAPEHVALAVPLGPRGPMPQTGDVGHGAGVPRRDGELVLRQEGAYEVVVVALVDARGLDAHVAPGLALRVDHGQEAPHVREHGRARAHGVARAEDLGPGPARHARVQRLEAPALLDPGARVARLVERLDGRLGEEDEVLAPRVRRKVVEGVPLPHGVPEVGPEHKIIRFARREHVLVEAVALDL